MKQYVLVLENDSKSQDEISQALKELDPELNIVLFSSKKELTDWRAKLDASGSAVLGVAPEQLDSKKSLIPLIVICDQLMAADSSDEVLGLQKELLYNKCCTDADVTSVVVVAYDKPGFKISKYQSEKIANVIFKPFDKLVLKQHLAYALSGRHPTEAKVLGSQQTTVEVEIIKDVQLVEISEVGFSTIIEREIPVGKLAKYYGPFTGPEVQSEIYAKCLGSRQQGDQLIGVFEYVSIDPSVISGIKKYLAKNKAQTRDIVPAQQGLNKIVNIAIVAADDFSGAMVGDYIKSEFRSVNTYRFPSLAVFLASIKPDKTIEHGNEKIFYIDALLIEQDQVVDYADATGKKSKENIQKILTTLQVPKETKLPIFILSNRKMTDQSFRGIINQVDDVFLQPFDKNFIIKVLFAKIPGMAWKADPYQVRWSAIPFQIYAANSIKAKEISEGGMVIEYHRAIEPGSFRKFVLWMPDQADIPQILASCNYYEVVKKDSSTVYASHFVFFGISDKFLKYIRVWIRHDFVNQKNSQG